MSDICPACGQKIQQAHKEMLSKAKLTMLKHAAEYVAATMKNDFKKSDVVPLLENSAYANFQKLRYHGLITQVKADGQRIRDRWLITRNGWSFLRGEISLPKFVLVKNNHIVSRSVDEVNIRDIFYGDPAFHTTFEYFDENGQAVGFKPVHTTAGRPFTQAGFQL